MVFLMSTSTGTTSLGCFSLSASLGKEEDADLGGAPGEELGITLGSQPGVTTTLQAVPVLQLPQDLASDFQTEEWTPHPGL